MQYLKIWTSFRDIIAPLNDEEVGRLFRMMLNYADSGYIPDSIQGNERFVFPIAKQMIDFAETKAETLRANGSKGGRPKSKAEQDEAEETKENQTKPDESKENQTKANERHKDKDNDKEYVKDNDKDKSNGGKPERLSIPPTVEEVAAYCKERGNGIDPEYFVAYYGKQNWKLSNGQKMTNWKMAVITWEKRDKESPPHPKPAGKIVSAQQYTQRAYSGQQETPEEMMARLAAMGAV